ncbi:response regulator [Aurantivibrio plasticivorans]
MSTNTTSTHPKLANTAPPKILVVEDSPLVLKIIRHVANAGGYDVDYAESFSKTKALVDQNPPYFAALVDLNLPDAPNGEVVDFALQHNINTIVLTASFDEQKREALLSKGIVDYVTKEGKFSYQYALGVIDRIYNNQHIKVLAVDDSDMSRKFIVRLLKQALFDVVEAKNGIEAIKVLLANPDIKLLITDYNMPQMDGFELVQNIRHKYEKSDLAVIGISGEGQSALSAKFIKAGANDFLNKPFNHEEFHCRIRHNIEALEHIEEIKDAADRDYLTGVYNRRYFYRRGQALHQQATENSTTLAAAVLDIDHFKLINEKFGVAGGDYVLGEFTKLLEEGFSRFLIARPSGEEFFILLPGISNEQALSLFTSVQELVQNAPIFIQEETVILSFSAGVTNIHRDSLQEQLDIANSYLYRAKDAGRNLVIGDDEDE